MQLHKYITENKSNTKMNCCESIVYNANTAYELKINDQGLKLTNGFGGGMGMKSICGALTGAYMVLGVFHKNNSARGEIRKSMKRLTDSFAEIFKDITCDPLKRNIENEGETCRNIIHETAKLLDEEIKYLYKNKIIS